ncbi:MAG: SH3 domain-containing protein, partial [Burkholderiaceae bacterium]
MTVSMRRWALGLLAAGAPLVVSAQPAITIGAVNVRAGPGLDFPLVATLMDHTPVQIEGCVTDYSWCDVWFGQLRGWVAAAYLSYPYRSSYVPIVQYGALIGLPVLAFSLGSYWDNHYRGQPWYGQRDAWMRRPPPVFRPAPPGFRPGPPMGYPPGHGPHWGPVGPGAPTHSPPSSMPSRRPPNDSPPGRSSGPRPGSGWHGGGPGPGMGGGSPGGADDPPGFGPGRVACAGDA